MAKQISKGKMKHLIFIVALISFVACREQDIEKSFFNAEKLDELHIENLSGFFGSGDPVTYPGPFNSYSAYVDGLGYENDGRHIFVSVFESKDKALEAMERRISTVSCIIETGAGEDLEYPWWYGDGCGNAIFKNQLNTIIEVSIAQGSFEERKELMVQTTKEIIDRMMDLSE